MKERKPNTLTTAAIHVNDDNVHTTQPDNVKIGFVVCGEDHDGILETIHGHDGCVKTKGFLTNTNSFVGEKVASGMHF